MNINNRAYQICKRCVMDTTAPDITFDDNGFCNFCTEYIRKSAPSYAKLREKQKSLSLLLDKIKVCGKKKKYDCIIGVSGGLDSSYTLYLAKQYGLRPLAVNLDNGWDVDFAKNNINSLVQKLRVDLYNYRVNWQEFRDLQLSLLKSHVVDIEMITDNAIQAFCYQTAKKFGIKYILAGTNTATEGMRMPQNWNWFKLDKKNILNIHKRFGSIALTTIPLMGTLDFIKYSIIDGIKWISFLDLVDYNKQNALNILAKDIGYHQYPYKHYESIFTRFYQGYILPRKFNIDKRKLHFSNLICSGQMTRAEAIEKLKEPPYPDANTMQEDVKIFLNKLDWTMEQLEEYVSTKGIPHEYYGTEKLLWHFFSQILKISRRILG